MGCRGSSRLEIGVHVDPPRRHVDRHPVPVAHERDGAAGRRLGRDVADHEPVRRAAESPIGHERARRRRGRGRPALRSPPASPACRAPPWVPRSGSRRRRPAGPPACTAANARASPSNTRAGPSCTSFPWPESFTTHPSGATVPRRIANPPLFFSGDATSRTTRCPSCSRASRASSKSDLPVTVGASSSNPASASRRTTIATPPTRCRSTAVPRHPVSDPQSPASSPRPRRSHRG